MARSVRYEFSKPVMREALARSGGRCEAQGEVYGLKFGERCNSPFKAGAKEFDHYPVPATMEGSNTLNNCVVCCPECHAWKTAKFDIPIQAKTKRVSDKAIGIRRAVRRGGFYQAEPQHNATRPLTKGVGFAFFQDPE